MLAILPTRAAALPVRWLRVAGRLFRGSLLAAGCVTIAFTSVGASAAPITYQMSDNFGTATLSGTITTDGTTGAVGNGNIVDWSILLDDGSVQFSMTKSPLNSELFSGNGVLQATATELAFDHSVNQIFLIRDFPIQNFWCLEGPANGCFGNPSTSNISVGGRFNQHVNTGRTGLHVYGTTVPEPGTLALVAMALAGVGAARKKPRR